MTGQPASFAEDLPAERPQRICVVGAGYVGLTAAACFAHLGHYVHCIESDPARLGMLAKGEIPIHEPGLAELVQEGMSSGRLRFGNDPAEALEGAAVAFLCVGTPPRSDGEPNLTYLAEAARQLARVTDHSLALVVKSTVPPGSCEAIELVCDEVTAEGISVSVVSSPEFLRESKAVWDFLNPDRVVVGAADAQVADLVASLYPPGVPVVRCDRRGAELVKYAANAFLAVKISFANEVAALCEKLGTNSATVLEGVGLDHRVGREFLNPGPGYGGSCLPKDVSGFMAVGRSVHSPTPVVTAAAEMNLLARRSVLDKLAGSLGTLEGRRIALLGLAFKAGTDDTRDSPAIALGKALVGEGAHVVAYDPLARVDLVGMERVPSALQAARGAEALVVATAWEEFAELGPQTLGEEMAGRVICDAVGIVDLESFSEAGFVSLGVGRGEPPSFHPVVWAPLRWAHTTDTCEPVTGAANGNEAHAA